MKAVVLREFGSPGNLVVTEMEDPVAGPGEVLIDVRAVPVTFPDCLMLEDKYQFKAPLPFVPAGELAGVVAALGDGVDELAIGDRVVASSGLVGAMAELVAVPVASARPIPDGVGFAESTGLMYAYGTSYYGLKYRGELQAGETMLVLGAGGNVGLTAVELGKLMGARVIAAASTGEKLSLCRDRGADETINYDDENLKERAKELTDGRGVDMVFDCVGGDYAEQALRATAWGGRFLVIGFTAGIPRIPLNLTLLKGCQIVGVFLGGMTAKEPELAAQIEGELLAFTSSGELRPYVSGRFSLEEAPMAFQALIDRKAVGKVVVEPR